MRGATERARGHGIFANYFNPRPPVRGATLTSAASIFSAAFQSTPPCAGGDAHNSQIVHKVFCISIHAPLCGGRQQRDKYYPSRRDFNPRPPVRGATIEVAKIASVTAFQSTPPCAGGDISAHGSTAELADFNPRPPVRGATAAKAGETAVKAISIHAPLCGGRPMRRVAFCWATLFQSTPPCAGGDGREI